MFKFYETPSNLIEEQDVFEKDINEFIKGNINPVKFKAIRVAHGVYEQRQEDTYMLRIRCAAGGITPTQLKKVAELGYKYGNGEVHFTTRSEVQIHNLLIHDVIKSIRGLNEVGLSSRGGGGNTIRNILTSPDSGISKEEAFDVDPYAMALTTRLIAEPDSWNMPRKFKIALSNSHKDTAFTQTTCLGYVATIRDGQKGFEVYCAGGMGAKPMVGHLLLDFIPDTKVYHVARALKTMFDKYGNRRSKHASRIKFLWKKLQETEFQELFRSEYDLIKDDESLNLIIPELKNEAKQTDLPIEEPNSQDEFEKWKQRYVFEQKQLGLFSIRIPLRLGDLFREDADKLADFLLNFGENTIRCQRGQNIQLRNIPKDYLGNAFNIITGLEHTLTTLPAFLGNMVNCTGAQTCKLGICLPRGLSDAIRNRLSHSNLDFDKISEFRLNMSGCPNTCGMHHIADLGFFGKIGRSKVNRDIYPAYYVLVGAKRGKAGKMEYAEKVDEIRAKAIPDLVFHFLENYITKKDSFSNYHDYLEQEGKSFIKAFCDKERVVPEFDEKPENYVDFGAKKRLSLDDMGTAECSAGMFDMIDVDKKTILKSKTSLKTAEESEVITELLASILFASARMLLVTRGVDAKSAVEVYEGFQEHFIQTKLINSKHLDVVILGKLGVKSALADQKDKILALADEVVTLYKSMDDSLRFKTQTEESKNIKETVNEKAEGSIDIKKDYRGVACPMNFVKAKLVLETMQKGQSLEILLDEGAPIQNVPNSIKLEGHKIIDKSKKDNYWSVLIQKD